MVDFDEAKAQETAMLRLWQRDPEAHMAALLSHLRKTYPGNAEREGFVALLCLDIDHRKLRNEGAK